MPFTVIPYISVFSLCDALNLLRDRKTWPGFIEIFYDDRDLQQYLRLYLYRLCRIYEEHFKDKLAALGFSISDDPEDFMEEFTDTYKMYFLQRRTRFRRYGKNLSVPGQNIFIAAMTNTD